MSGKVVKFHVYQESVGFYRYRSINSLLQLHQSEDAALTCYKIKGGRGQGGIEQAWSEQELKKFMKNNHQETEKWLID